MVVVVVVVVAVGGGGGGVGVCVCVCVAELFRLMPFALSHIRRCCSEAKESIQLPDTIVHIGDFAFQRCIALKLGCALTFPKP